MSISNHITTDSAVIQAAPDSGAGGPLTVHRETILGELPDHRKHEYVLVAGDDRRIIGVVPSREIDRRLLSTNRFERTRWHAMPIGAMLTMSLAGEKGAGPKFDAGQLNCTTICEDGQLFGLSVNGDLFLSWRRLEAMFTAALSDPLTGLMNRLAYERRLREEWNRSQRTGNSIAVVVVDLDDFKGVNDTYGHVVGDELLARVGRQLEVSMRSYDVVARFGGDEFVALCLGCGPGAIEIPVRRLLDSIAEIEMQVARKTIRVAASVGAAVRHSGFAGSQPEDLFVAADQCLYESKKSSSNSWKIEFGGNVDSFAKPISLRSADDPKTLALSSEP